jgi:hypothetical protein
VHLVNKFNISCIKSVVHIPKDYGEISKNIAIKMFLMGFSTLTLFYEIRHHFISCNNCILTMPQVTCHKVKIVIAKVKVKLDSTFVPNHSK